jgi:hypothetical protein
MGLALLNPAKLLKVAIEMKKQTPQMTRVDRRRNCRRGGMVDQNTVQETEGAMGEKLTQSDMGVPSSANWNPTKPLITIHQYKAPMNPA